MAILTGVMRLGRDCEVRYTAGGEAVASLALAYNYGKKEGNEQPTTWVDASLWGKRAEALCDHLTKGTAIEVVLTEVHVHTYEKKGGGYGASLRGKVLELNFAGGKSNAEQRQASRAPEQSQSTRDPNAYDDSDLPF